MKTILLASAVALGLSTAATFAASPSGGYVYSPAMPALGGVATQQSANTDTQGPGFGAYITRSRPNPTGQTEYGPQGEISLWAPDLSGGGN